jgi:hypothetical protein
MLVRLIVRGRVPKRIRDERPAHNDLCSNLTAGGTRALHQERTGGGRCG